MHAGPETFAPYHNGLDSKDVSGLLKWWFGGHKSRKKTIVKGIKPSPFVLSCLVLSCLAIGWLYCMGRDNTMTINNTLRVDFSKNLGYFFNFDVK